jgi:hypothetical protein
MHRQAAVADLKWQYSLKHQQVRQLALDRQEVLSRDSTEGKKSSASIKQSRSQHRKPGPQHTFQGWKNLKSRYMQKITDVLNLTLIFGALQQLHIALN